MPKTEEITASAVAVPVEPTKAPEPWYKNESPVDFTACSAFCGLYYRSNLSKPFYSFEAQEIILYNEIKQILNAEGGLS